MEPVNATARRSLCFTNSIPASSPLITDINPAGAPTELAARTIISPTIVETIGWPGLIFITTAHPAARAEAVSPPATPNANGKLLAPNIPTTPSGIDIDRSSGRGGVSVAFSLSMTISK